MLVLWKADVLCCGQMCLSAAPCVLSHPAFIRFLPYAHINKCGSYLLATYSTFPSML